MFSSPLTPIVMSKSIIKQARGVFLKKTPRFTHSFKLKMKSGNSYDLTTLLSPTTHLGNLSIEEDRPPYNALEHSSF